MKRVPWPLRTRPGFTLIELLVALSILAALATVALPLTQVAATRNREEALRRALWQMREAIDRYRKAVDDGNIAKPIDGSGYPPDLDILVQGVTDQKDPQGRKMYFLRFIPRDPFCDCNSRAASATWGKRSYASPPDHPQPGKDVYDVYSMTPGTGLNGVPYRDW